MLLTSCTNEGITDPSELGDPGVFISWRPIWRLPPFNMVVQNQIVYLIKWMTTVLVFQLAYCMI